jgi:hypothetical protein
VPELVFNVEDLREEPTIAEAALARYNRDENLKKVSGLMAKNLKNLLDK